MSEKWRFVFLWRVFLNVVQWGGVRWCQVVSGGVRWCTNRWYTNRWYTNRWCTNRWCTNRCKIKIIVTLTNTQLFKKLVSFLSLEPGWVLTPDHWVTLKVSENSRDRLLRLDQHHCDLSLNLSWTSYFTFQSVTEGIRQRLTDWTEL